MAASRIQWEIFCPSFVTHIVLFLATKSVNCLHTPQTYLTTTRPCLELQWLLWPLVKERVLEENPTPVEWARHLKLEWDVKLWGKTVRVCHLFKNQHARHLGLYPPHVARVWSYGDDGRWRVCTQSADAATARLTVNRLLLAPFVCLVNGLWWAAGQRYRRIHLIFLPPAMNALHSAVPFQPLELQMMWLRSRFSRFQPSHWWIHCAWCTSVPRELLIVITVLTLSLVWPIMTSAPVGHHVPHQPLVTGPHLHPSQASSTPFSSSHSTLPATSQSSDAGLPPFPSLFLYVEENSPPLSSFNQLCSGCSVCLRCSELVLLSAWWFAVVAVRLELCLTLIL